MTKDEHKAFGKHSQLVKLQKEYLLEMQETFAMTNYENSASMLIKGDVTIII